MGPPLLQRKVTFKSPDLKAVPNHGAWSAKNLFTFKSLSSRTGRGRAELVHSNDLICHMRAQNIYSVKTISMCAVSRMSC